mmetsp:Transcript_21330/g.43797  ORF Transcript_21330/g.43797 Transcript_21330/m.43797 type:complete len:486 (+) Transcript_21330:101-1558(+)
MVVRTFDSLTVLVQTSPLPSHPSSALIEALFRSFSRVDGLNDCNIIIVCDGCEEAESPCGGRRNDSSRSTEPFHDEKNVKYSRRRKTKTSKKIDNKHNYKHGIVSSEAACNYRLYLNHLQEKIYEKVPPFNPSAKGSIRLLRLPHRHGSAKAIATAFDQLNISTPYVMIAQHDNFFIRDVQYLQQILNFMDDDDSKSWLQCVHFPSTATLKYVPKIKRRYGLDLENFCRPHKSRGLSQTAEKLCDLDGTFVPLIFWYGRTHIARTTYYTDMILRHFPLNVGDHLEELWGTRQLREILQCSAKTKSKNGHESEDNTAQTSPDDVESRFRKVHDKYGNYVFFDNSHSSKCTPPAKDVNFEQHEVIYHLSGRKARAATNNASEAEINYSFQIHQSPSVQRYAPQGTSFTTARRALALVPGLEFPHTKECQQELCQSESDVSQLRPIPKRIFKQRCFHCGEKGHSFKYCSASVSRDDEVQSKTEVLDLS